MVTIIPTLSFEGYNTDHGNLVKTTN